MSIRSTYIDLVNDLVRAAQLDGDLHPTAERELVEAKVRLLAAIGGITLQSSRPLLPDQTYCLRGEGGEEEHYAIVSRRIFGPWHDRGAAVAGMQTEQRRAAKRDAKSCICSGGFGLNLSCPVHEGRRL